MEGRRPPPPTTPERSHQRWTLIRDLVVFETKMLLEGMRDVLVVPLALVAALADLLLRAAVPGRFFYSLMAAGRGFDEWLNLFGRAPAAVEETEAERGLDQHLRRLEQLLLEQHRRGGVTAQAQQRIDRLLDRMGEAGRAQGPR